MDRRMAADLDRYITGNYGEDSVGGEIVECCGCGEQWERMDDDEICPGCGGSDIKPSTEVD